MEDKDALLVFHVCEALSRSLADVAIGPLHCGATEISPSMLMEALKAEPHEHSHPSSTPALAAKAFAEDVVANALVNIRVSSTSASTFFVANVCVARRSTHQCRKSTEPCAAG
jgi:hypothetical protein